MTRATQLDVDEVRRQVQSLSQSGAEEGTREGISRSARYRHPLDAAYQQVSPGSSTDATEGNDG